MTKKELKDKLIAGAFLVGLFDFTVRVMKKRTE